ncbi:hypothetical protein AS156_14715 [Bradyrhizobium macuxiense]|uniref:Aminotransferase class III n=1 Tax=Bradyrhizobium macuxiense TaxID=1755647 RepID=A0A109JJ71_9BRAD|nr:aminotransferase class III-fold pyridoxal phosphate-dependent enzyme [Bradyrhizobium macuxiense]KWV50022.1 hypothetical protein AS156_14715 [Bradyrhizobium macuxiense]
MPWGRFSRRRERAAHRTGLGNRRPCLEGRALCHRYQEHRPAEPRDGAAGARGIECAARSYDDGILIRSAGDTLMISPPLIITEEQIEAIFAAIRRALNAIA